VDPAVRILENRQWILKIKTAKCCSESLRAGTRSCPEIGICWKGANLRGAQLTGVNLGNANLSRACFVGANLYYAFLNTTDLSYADLEGACLRGADIEDSNLMFARLANADLSMSSIGGSARLAGANLFGADLTNARFGGAIYDSTTIFPEGFDPRAVGMLTHEEWQRNYGFIAERTLTSGTDPRVSVVVSLSRPTRDECGSYRCAYQIVGAGQKMTRFRRWCRRVPGPLAFLQDDWRGNIADRIEDWAVPGIRRGKGVVSTTGPTVLEATARVARARSPHATLMDF
jgi:hypothetical protein